MNKTNKEAGINQQATHLGLGGFRLFLGSKQPVWGLLCPATLRPLLGSSWERPPVRGPLTHNGFLTSELSDPTA